MLFFVRREIADNKMDYPSDFGGTLRFGDGELVWKWVWSTRPTFARGNERGAGWRDAKSSDPVSIERDRRGEKEKDGETPSESSPAKTRPGLRIFARTHADGAIMQLRICTAVSTCACRFAGTNGRVPVSPVARFAF